MRSRFGNLAAVAGAAVLALAASAAAPSKAAAQKLIPVKVGYDGYSMTTGPMNYALKTGIFKKHGLDVTLVYIDGGSTLTQAVVGGSVDIGQNGYTPAIAAAVHGADVVFIGGIPNKLPFQLVVKNGINSGADLKGKKIAISRFGSSTDTAAQIAVGHLGLKKSDVVILQLGGEATRTAAMLSNQIDGSLEQYPRTGELDEQGFHVLVDCTNIAGDYPNTSYDTTRGYLKKHADVIKDFMASIAEGIHAYKTNKAEALKITLAFLKAKPGRPMEKAYDFYTKEIYPEPPYPSLKGIQLVLDAMKAKIPAAGKMKPEQLVDTSALDQLKSEGYFKNLE